MQDTREGMGPHLPATRLTFQESTFIRDFWSQVERTEVSFLSLVSECDRETELTQTLQTTSTFLGRLVGWADARGRGR